MQVLFESRNPEALVLRGVVVSRARFVMRRLVWLVPRARVCLTDVNGPRGGVDKRCQVELRAAGGAPVVVTSVARDWRSALDAALTRAARALLRLWQRERRHQRPLPRRPAPQRRAA